MSHIRRQRARFHADVERSFSARVALPEPFPAEAFPGADFPRRADVIVRQLADDTWQLQDRLGQPLSAITYDDVCEARARATQAAEASGGVVWLWSDRPRRFERR